MKKIHAQHQPIDDDYDDDDLVGMSKADVKGVSHKPGTPEHEAYSRELDELLGSDVNQVTYKRPAGEAGGKDGKLDLSKYYRR